MPHAALFIGRSTDRLSSEGQEVAVLYKGGVGRLYATAMEATVGLKFRCRRATARSAQRMRDATLVKKLREDLDICGPARGPTQVLLTLRSWRRHDCWAGQSAVIGRGWKRWMTAQQLLTADDKPRQRLQGPGDRGGTREVRGQGQIAVRTRTSDAQAVELLMATQLLILYLSSSQMSLFPQSAHGRGATCYGNAARRQQEACTCMAATSLP